MRGTTIAPVQVLRELGRLLDVYTRPAQWPKGDEAVAASWAGILSGVSVEQLAQAVTAYIRGDHSFMPKPGQLRTLALQQPGVSAPGADGDSFEAWMRRGYTDADGALAPCPACGRAWQAHPRVTLVHDHSRHRALGLPCLNTCDEMACLGTYAVPPSSAPTRVSAGALWTPPADWRSDLKGMLERREVIKHQRDLPPPAALEGA